MTPPPARPMLYHITHVDNLAGIATDGRLLSDRAMIARGGPMQAIGMSTIKRRRVEELRVACHPGTQVGDYVPFYFCPRSVMLYVIWRANHPELSYRGGQDSIVHLQADLHQVVQRANASGQPWAFSTVNAGARYAHFYDQLSALDCIDWEAVKARDFRDPGVKERKQAEFLLHEQFPFGLVVRIGTRSAAVRARTLAALADTAFEPAVEVRRAWYF